MYLKLTIYFDHYQTDLIRKLNDDNTVPDVIKMKSEVDKELVKQMGEAIHGSENKKHFLFSFHRGVFSNCIGVTWEFLEYPFEIK